MHRQRNIDLSGCKILMHSAIQESIRDYKLFDGILSKPIIFSELNEVLRNLSK